MTPDQVETRIGTLQSVEGGLTEETTQQPQLQRVN